MRRSILVMVFVSGCVAGDPPESVRVVVQRPASAPAVAVAEPDLCALAGQLAADDICSMICDPGAMQAELADEGTPPGRCVELACALPGGTSVQVGICLPP